MEEVICITREDGSVKAKGLERCKLEWGAFMACQNAGTSISDEGH